MMKRIAIWGTGDVTQEFLPYMENVEVVCYLETCGNKKQYNGIAVYQLSEFLSTPLPYDYIIVANAFSNEIYELCIENKMDMSKLVFLRPLQNTHNVELYKRNLKVLYDIAPNYIEEALKEADRRMGIDGKESPILDANPIYYYDYFRYRTFELVADEIQDVEGDLAEVGVFKGNFAAIINRKFPQDTFWLFDTFEGFDEAEASRELNAGNCDEKFIQEFKETSVEQVMGKMAFPDLCVVRKGLFPGTAEGIERQFKFVSIDVDFEDSIYEAIKFFYPRLVEGGYIFIHDYNEGRLKGVRAAVKRYETEAGRIVKVPIADKCGTLIITK